jgi:hypothetical protein
MATRRPVEQGKNGKIRFLLFEADGVDGNLSDIANAISSAFRSQTPVNKAITSGAARKAAALPPIDVETLNDNGEDVEADETEETAPQPARSGPAKKRPPRKVTVLPDVDLNSGDMPLAKFLESKNPTSRFDRYLAIAYWFKHNRGLDTITGDHIYTAYRKMGWTSDIPDMTQPFRDLKRAGKGSSSKGTFTINHLGEDAVSGK